MSIFGAFKKGRKAAKVHHAKLAEKQQQEQQAPGTKYHHVPTHAASDALLGAPYNWNKDDASKIREHNKRRSEMLFLVAQTPGGSASSSSNSSAIMLNSMRTGMSRNQSSKSLGGSGQWSRANSGLSKVSYPDGPSGPAAHPAHSYTGMDATLQQGGAFTTAPDSLAAGASSALPPGASLSKGASSSSTSCSSYTPPVAHSSSSSTSLSAEDGVAVSSAEKGKGKLQG